MARQPLELSAAGAHFTAPATLDRLDPHWLVGTLTLDAPETVTITVEPKHFGLLGTLLGATGSVRALDALHNLPLGAIAATRTDIAPRIVPIAQACGQWVEWYAPEIAQS